MKHYTLILAAIFIATLTNCVAQIGPSIQWQACYGGSSNDYNPKIKKTDDGGFIMLSSTSSNNQDVTGNHGSYDGWLVKLDSSGAIQWQHCFGGTASDYSADIITAFDGGYLLEVYTNSSNGQVTGSHGGSEIWIVKTDSSGNLLWQHPLGGSTSEVPGSILQLPDSTILVCGYTLSNDGDVSGNHGNGDAWVVKLKKDGTIIWQHCYGGPQTDFASALILLSDGNCIIAGHTNSNDDDVSGNHGGQDAWAIKIDTAGNLLWSHCYGGTGDESFLALRENNNRLEFAGTASSVDGDVSGNHGGSDFWVVLSDENGNLLKEKCFGGTGTELLSSIVAKPNNGFALCGESNSNDGDVIGNHSIGGLNDGWLMRSDSSFNLIWSRCYGGTGTDFGFRMIAYSSQLMIAGSTNSNDDDVDCTDHGLLDLWLFRTSDECDIPIQASFEYEQNDLEFSFSDESEKASTWLWDFGDGNSSTEKNPVHEYSNPGIYQVCLGITDSCGYDTSCTIINTCGYATAAFGYEQNDLTFLFSDSSKLATSWLWDFGDGNTSTEENPSYTFLQPGIYTVSLKSGNACNTDSFSVIINTCGTLSADFGYSTFQLVASFSDSSSSNVNLWLWEFGDGFGSNQQNPNHAYALPGNYTVTLLVNDDCEAKFATKYITVCATAKALFSFTSSGGDVSFTNNSVYGTSFIWNFGNGVTTSLVDPDYFFSDTGIFSICLAAQNICSADDTCITFHNTYVPNINYCWQQTYADSTGTDASAAFIAADDSNNIITSGYSDQGILPLLYENLFTIKYSPQGNLVWKKNLADEFADDYFQPIDLVVDHDGSTIVLFAWQQFPSFYDNWGMAKYNLDGVLEWTFSGELTNNERANAMEVDADGNIVVVGSGFGATFTGDYLIEKIDGDGNQVWKTSYDYAGFSDAANDVAITDDGKIYITGAAIADEFDEHEKMATVTYDADGNFQSQSIHGNDISFGKQVITNKSNDVWAIGGDSYFGESPLVYVERIGAVPWFIQYSGPPDLGAEANGISIAVDSSDISYVAVDVSYHDANNTEQTYPALLKYDGEGNLLIEKEVSGSFVSDDGSLGFVMTKMIATKAGKVFYTGYSKPSGLGNNYFDVETGRLNSEGSIDWLARFNDASLEDYGYDVALDHSGNILVAGRSETNPENFEMLSLKYCIQCSAQAVVFNLPQDTFCLNTESYVLTGGNPPGGQFTGDGVIDGSFDADSAGLGAHNIIYSVADVDGCISTDTETVFVDVCLGTEAPRENYFDVFPNPFSQSATIECFFTSSGQLNIDLMDLSGRIVQSIYGGTCGAGNFSCNISAKKLPAGTYLIRIQHEGEILARKIMVMQ